MVNSAWLRITVYFSVVASTGEYVGRNFLLGDVDLLQGYQVWLLRNEPSKQKPLTFPEAFDIPRGDSHRSFHPCAGAHRTAVSVAVESPHRLEVAPIVTLRTSQSADLTGWFTRSGVDRFRSTLRLLSRVSCARCFEPRPACYREPSCRTGLQYETPPFARMERPWRWCPAILSDIPAFSIQCVAGEWRGGLAH